MRDFLLSDRLKNLPEGLTRRDFARLATLLAAGATLPFYNEFTLAQDIKAIARIPPDAVKLNANENPLGPCPEALEAIRRVAPLSGRYLFHEPWPFPRICPPPTSCPPPVPATPSTAPSSLSPPPAGPWSPPSRATRPPKGPLASTGPRSSRFPSEGITPTTPRPWPRRTLTPA
jgi:hypothetical protein